MVIQFTRKAYTLSPIYKQFAYPYHQRRYFARLSRFNVASPPLSHSPKASTLKLPPTPKFNPETGKWEVPPQDLPMPSKYDNIKYEHGAATGTRRITSNDRSYTPDAVQLAGYPEPKNLSPQWTGAQLAEIKRQEELRQGFRNTIGGEDPFIAGSRLTPVLNAVKRGEVPMQQVMQMRALVQKYQNKQMSQNDLVRALSKYGEQSTEHKQGSSSVDFRELETRAQRLNQMRLATPDVNQHIEDMAEYLQIPLDQARRLIGSLTDQQYKAVTSRAQALTIFGGPGAGKTHTLLQRTAQIESQGADLNKFLVVSASHAGSQAFVQRLKGDMAIAHPNTKVNEIQGRTPWSHAMGFLHKGYTDEQGNKIVDEDGNTMNAMREMGHGAYKPMGGRKKNIDPGDLLGMMSKESIGEEEREYLEKVLAQFGIKVQDMSQVAQDIKTAKENRLITEGDQSLKARLASGKRKYEAHEMNHPDTYLYLYEQSRQMAVKAITGQGTANEKIKRFGIEGQTNPLFDLSDTLHFGYVAAKRPANKHRLVEGIIADEAQDFGPDAIGYLAAVAKPGAQIVMAGDMSQQNIFKENHVNDLIKRIMTNQKRSFESVELTGSNRLNPWNTALVNSLNANEALEGMPKSPYMTSIAPGSSYPDPEDFPDFRYEPTWHKTYQNQIEKWFGEMGVTAHDVAQNVSTGRKPFHGSTMAPEQYPHIFMMKDQRKLFEDGLRQYMFQQLGGEAAEQILPQIYTNATPSEATRGLMHGSMMSQMKGKESERAMVTMSRGGLWEFHQYQNQLLTMGSRVKGRQTFYGSGQNLGSKVYNQRPDMYQGVKLPHGTLGIVSRLLENAIVQQGVAMESVPKFWQPLAKMVFANKVVQGESAKVDTHAMQTLASFVTSAIRQRFVQPLLDNDKSGLMQGGVDDFIDADGRKNMAGFQTYKLTPAGLAGKHEDHIDMERFHLADEAFRQIVEGGPQALANYGYKDIPDIETMMSGHAEKGKDIPQFMKPAKLDREAMREIGTGAGDLNTIINDAGTFMDQTGGNFRPALDEDGVGLTAQSAKQRQKMHDAAMQVQMQESLIRTHQEAMQKAHQRGRPDRAKAATLQISQARRVLETLQEKHHQATLKNIEIEKKIKEVRALPGQGMKLIPKTISDEENHYGDLDKKFKRPNEWVETHDYKQARRLVSQMMTHPTFRAHPQGYEMLRSQFADPRMVEMIHQFTKKRGLENPFSLIGVEHKQQLDLAEKARASQDMEGYRYHQRLASNVSSDEAFSKVVESLVENGEGMYPDLTPKIWYKAASMTSMNAANMGDIHDILGDLGNDKSLHPALQSTFRRNSEQLQMLHDPQPEWEKENRPPIALSQEALSRLVEERPLEAKHLQHILSNGSGGLLNPIDAAHNISGIAPLPSSVYRTVGAEGHDLGVTPAHSHAREFTTKLEALHNQLEGSMHDIDAAGSEQGGMFDPMHGMSQEVPGGGSVFHPHGSPVTLSGYETRLKDMLGATHHTLAPQHHAELETQLKAVQQLKGRFNDPQMMEQYGHQLNIVSRLALGGNPLDPTMTSEDRKRGKLEPIDKLFAPMGNTYGAQRTLPSVVKFANTLQIAMEHTQRTGTIQRGHVDALLSSMGHDPKNAEMFKGLEYLRTQKKFQKPEDTISLVEMIHTMFPKEANRLLGELTPTPLHPDEEMVFTGSPQGPQQVGRMQTGMRGELAEFPALSVNHLEKLKGQVISAFHPSALRRRLGEAVDRLPFGNSRSRIHMTSKTIDMMSPQEKEELTKLHKASNIYNVHKDVAAGVPFLFRTAGAKQFPVLASQVMPAHIYDRLQNGGGEISLTPPSPRVVAAGPGSGARPMIDHERIMNYLAGKAQHYMAPWMQPLAKHAQGMAAQHQSVRLLQAPPVPPASQLLHPQEAELLQTVKKINMIQPGRIVGGGSAPASRRRRALAERRAGQAVASGDDPAATQRIYGFLPAALPPHLDPSLVSPSIGHATLVDAAPRANFPQQVLDLQKHRVLPYRDDMRQSAEDAYFASLGGSVVGPETYNLSAHTIPGDPRGRTLHVGALGDAKVPMTISGGGAGIPPTPPRTGFALPHDDDEGRGGPSEAQFHAPPTLAASMADLHRWLREGNAAQGIKQPSDEQLEVLDDASHHKIIEGGPGGGKTATLMRAVMEAITNGGIRPDQVQMFSAMHSGTQALEQSYGPSKHGPGYQGLLPKGDEYRFKGPSTFHSVASSILMHGSMHDEEGKLFYPNLQKLGLGHLTGNIMEDPSQEQLAGMGPEDRKKALANAPSTMLRELLAQHGENPSQDKLFDYLKEINRIKNQRGMPGGHYEESLATGRYQLAQPGHPMTYEGMTALYEGGLHQRGAMDYQDQLHYAARAMEELPDQNIPKHLFNKRLVAVDEAQDTTHGAMSFLQSFLRRVSRSGTTPRVFVGMDRMQSLMQNLGGIDQHQIKGHFQSLLNVPWVHGLTKNFRSDAGAVALNNAILQDPLLKGEPKSPEQVPINTSVGKGIDFQLAKSQPTLYKKMVRSMFGQAGLDPREIAANIKSGQHALAGIDWAQHQGTLPSQVPAIVSTRDQQNLLEHEAHQMLMGEGLSHSEAKRGVSQLFRRNIPSSNAPVEQKEALTQFPVLRVGGSRSFQFQEPHIDATRVGGWLSETFDMDKAQSYLRNLFTGVSRVSTGGQTHIFAANRTFYKNQLHSYMHGAAFSDTQPDNPEDGSVELNGHAILARNNPQNAFEHYNGQLVPQMFSGILERRDAQLANWQGKGMISGYQQPGISPSQVIRSNSPRPANMAPPARIAAAGAPTPHSGSGGSVNITMPSGSSVNVNAPSVQVNTTGGGGAPTTPPPAPSTATGGGSALSGHVGVPASQLFGTPIPGGGPSMAPPRSGPISGGGRPAGTGGGGGPGGPGHSAFAQFNNEPAQLGHSLARIGSELQYLGQLGSSIIDKAVQQASDYRQATMPLTGNVSGANGTTGFFDFTPGGNGGNNINQYSHATLPMYSNTQVAQGIQNLTGMTNTQFSQGKTLPSLTDIMGLAAITGMDPTQLMAQMTGITGMQGGGSNATVSNTQQLTGMLTQMYGTNLTQSNVAPTLDTLQNTLPTVQGLSPGGTGATAQVMSLMQLGLNSGMSSNNLGQVGNVIGSLAQAGSTPTLQQQYGLGKLFGFQNLTAVPELAQFQTQQTGEQQQLAELQLQQNIGGGISLPKLQIQISQAQISMDQANFDLSSLQQSYNQANYQLQNQSGQLNLAYGQASYQFNLQQQNAQYGPIGADDSKTAYFSWLRSQQAASYNGTSPELATQATAAPTFGLQNAEFYANMEHQRQQMVLSRSPLLSDMAFQNNMKYINQQEAFYQAQLKLTNDSRTFTQEWQGKMLDEQAKELAFNETWQPKLLAAQASQLAIQGEQLALQKEMATYEQKNDEIQNQFLGDQVANLQALMKNQYQQINGQGPLKGEDIQPQQIVEQMAAAHLSDADLHTQIKTLGIPLDQQNTLFQLVKQLSKQGGSLAEIDKKFNSASDKDLKAQFDKMVKSGAFASAQQQAAGANASLDFAGLGAKFDNLVKTLDITNTALENMANFFSPSSSFALAITAIAAIAGPLVTAVASISNIIGIIQATLGGGAAAGGAGDVVAGIGGAGVLGAGGFIGAGLLGTAAGMMWGAGDGANNPQTDWASGFKGLMPGYAMGRGFGQIQSLITGDNQDKDMQNGWNGFWGNFGLGPNANKTQGVEATPGARSKHGGLADITMHPPTTPNKSQQPDWNSFTTTLGKNWTSFTTGASKGWSTFTTGAGKGWDTVTTGVSKGWTSFTSNVSKLWNTTITGIGSWWRGVVTAVQTDWKNVVSSVGTFWSNVGTTVHKDWDNLTTTVTKNFSDLVTGFGKNWSTFWSDRAKDWGTWWSDRGKDFQTWLSKLNIFNTGGGGASGGVVEGHPGFTTPHVNTEFGAPMWYGKHQGVDFAAAQGTPLAAFNGGKVVGSGFYPWGGEIDVDIGNGLIERYLHLSLLGVTNGQNVKEGQRIGLTGGGTIASGLGYWSKGAHSHVQVDQGNINAGINPWPIWEMSHDMNLAQFYTGAAISGQGSANSAVLSAALGAKGGGAHHFHDGGVAMMQMQAQVAESEPEAIIPISKLTQVLQSTFNSTQSQQATNATTKSLTLSKIAEKLEIHVHTTSASLDENAQDSLMTQLLSIFNEALKEANGKLT